MLGLTLGLGDVAVRPALSIANLAAGPLAVARPVFALGQAWNLWGDSTTFGVGAPGGADYPQALRAMAAAGGGGPAGVACHLGSPSDGTRAVVCNGGVAGENTGTIAARVATLSTGTYAAEMQRPQIFSGGLNNYNAGVPGSSRNWPAQVIGDLAANAARVGGGREWFHILAPAEDNRGDGMMEGAAHVHHRREMIAVHGHHILNFQRLARDHPSELAVGGYDRIQVATNGAVPASLRGGGPVAIPPYSDAAPLVVAGVPSDLSAGEGQFAWNGTGLTLYRKLGASGGGSWQPCDVKHFSGAGYALMARMVGDAMMASEGTGPSFASPQEILTTTDVVAGTELARIVMTGVATRCALTVDRAGTTPSTQFAMSPLGAVTRIGADELPAGMQTLYVWTSNAAGTLRTVVDIYVDRPAGTRPDRFLIGGSGIALYGRESHGFPGGQQIAGAMLVRVDTLSSAPTLVNWMKGPGGNTSFAVKVLPDGRISFVGNNNAATTTLGVNCATTAGQALVAGAWTWVMFSLDFAASVASVWFNDAARTLGAFPGSGAQGGSFTFADTSPLMLAGRPPQQYDDGLNVLKGGIGPLLLFPGTVDWSNVANRRALFDADGRAAVRTPFAPVGGVVPHFDTSAGLGGFLYGTAAPGDPQTLLIPSWRARSLLSINP